MVRHQCHWSLLLIVHALHVFSSTSLIFKPHQCVGQMFLSDVPIKGNVTKSSKSKIALSPENIYMILYFRLILLKHLECCGKISKDQMKQEALNVESWDFKVLCSFSEKMIVERKKKRQEEKSRNRDRSRKTESCYILSVHLCQTLTIKLCFGP